MKKPSFTRKQLNWGLMLLYTSLNDLRYEAPGIWPVCELDDETYHDFFLKLNELASDCLVMHWCGETPTAPYALTTAGPYMDFPDMIRFTRELLWCCDTDLIYEYRSLAPGEYETIRLLEQTHAQLIGAHYYQHPGEDTLDADKLCFL